MPGSSLDGGVGVQANRPILEADGLGKSFGREVVFSRLEEPTPV